MRLTIAVILGGDVVKGAAALEVVETELEKREGLSNRASVSYNTGMLFPEPGPFWMKDVYVPLDLVYVRDGFIVDIIRMDVAVDEKLKIYSTEEEADYAMEFPAGWVKEKGITIGDEVLIPKGVL